jgi:antitoxin VapB
MAFMPLYIRDDEVDALAAELQALTGAPTKTEAVRRALTNEIQRSREKLPLRDRLAGAIAKARALGPRDAEFDMKSFTDEMWNR